MLRHLTLGPFNSSCKLSLGEPRWKSPQEYFPLLESQPIKGSIQLKYLDHRSLFCHVNVINVNKAHGATTNFTLRKRSRTIDSNYPTFSLFFSDAIDCFVIVCLEALSKYKRWYFLHLHPTRLHRVFSTFSSSPLIFSNTKDPACQTRLFLDLESEDLTLQVEMARLPVSPANDSSPTPANGQPKSQGGNKIVSGLRTPTAAKSSSMQGCSAAVHSRVSRSKVLTPEKKLSEDLESDDTVWLHLHGSCLKLTSK